MFAHEKRLTLFFMEDFFIASHVEDIYLLQQFISLKKKILIFFHLSCHLYFKQCLQYKCYAETISDLLKRIYSNYLYFLLFFLLFLISNFPRGEGGRGVGENYFDTSFTISKLTLVNKAKGRITGIHVSWIIKDCFH